MFQNLMPWLFSDFLASLFLIFSSIQLLLHTITECLALYLCYSILSVLGGNLTLYKPPGLF